MNPTTRNFIKIISFGAILIAFFILGKSLYYSPNQGVESDSGLSVAQEQFENITSTSKTGYPARLQIPKLGIDTEVQHVGVTKSGNMAAPNNFTDVSWYKYGTKPGDVGSAVMAGHEDNAVSLDGVFKRLEDLVVGDDIYVIDSNHTKHHFRVARKQILPYNVSGKALQEIFHAADKARLNLITCAGDWLPEAKTNDQRLVIYTELVK